MRVTVVLPTLDEGPFLKETIDSVVTLLTGHDLHFIIATAREIEAALTQDYLRSRRLVLDATIDMSKRWKGDGLLALDNRGRLVKFNIAAHSALRRYGIDIALTPETRVAALDLDLPEQERWCLRPHWLLPQWLQPVMRGKLRVGTLIVIPTAECHGS